MVTEHENRIMRKVIADALAAGFKLSVYDGEETTVVKSADAEQIFAALRTTDEDWLHFFKDDQRIGFVYFVYGNEGFDVICDYTVLLEPVLKEANELADVLSGD